MLESNNPGHKKVASDDLAINREEQDSAEEQIDLLFGQKLASDTQVTTSEILNKFAQLAIPAVLSNLFMMIVSVMNVVFVGQLNDAAKLAGCGLGNTISAICGFSIMVGLNGAIDTLASHAFGDNDLRLCGVYLNRGRLILITFSIPLVVLQCFTREILIGIGQDPLVSHYAHLLVVCQLPGTFLLGQFDLQKRFLNCLQVTWVPMIASGAGTILHALWCYIFIIRLDYGVAGAGLAMSTTYLIQYSVIILYSCCLPHISKAFTCPDKQSFDDWGEYLAISLPATLMICAEWWCFEVLALLAGYIGVVDQATQVILFNLCALMFMIPLGIQEATCALIGAAIGAQNVRTAKKMWKIISLVALGCFLIVSIAMYLARRQFAQMYTHEENVVAKVVQTMPLLSLMYFADGAQGFLQGPIRALKSQAKASIAALFSYYAIAIPVSLIFAFWVKLGVAGLWIGMSFGVIFQTILYWQILYRLDWSSVANESKARRDKANELTRVNGQPDESQPLNQLA